MIILFLTSILIFFLFRIEAITNIDADEPIIDNDDNDSDDETDDDEDDTAELLAELERIKKER